MMHRHVSVRSTFVLLAIATVVVFAAACSSGDAGTSGEGSFSEERLAATVEGLCEARALAADGRVEDAGRAFDDRAHGPLHELAPAVQEEDPAAAARLLEAKQGVEAALRDGEANGPELAERMDRLTEAVRTGAAALGMEAPECEG